jgi:hypothetical protein
MIAIKMQVGAESRKTGLQLFLLLLCVILKKLAKNRYKYCQF